MATSSGGGVSECPVCGKLVSDSIISIHVDQCLEPSSSSSSSSKRVKPASGAPSNAFAVLMANAKSTSSSSSAAKKQQRSPPPVVVVDEEDSDEATATTTNNNAFSVLMGKAKELAVVETFSFDFATGECQWTNSNTSSSSSSDSDWHGVVKLGRGAGDKHKIRLVGRNLPQGYSSTSFSVSPKSRLPVGTLKSIMQKAYRRMDHETFRRAAGELASKSWTDFLRRLPIVILEDGYCTRSLPALVWLMLADTCVRDGDAAAPRLCNEQVAHFCIYAVPFDDMRREEAEAAAVPTAAALGDLSALPSPQAAAVVFAMRARAKFGGMKCDVDMCVQLAERWHDRLLINEYDLLLPPCTTTLIPHHTLQGFADDYAIPCAGVDTHCQPALFESLATEDVGSLMWQFRGGLNRRHGLLERDMEARERGEYVPELAQSEAYQRWRLVAGECNRISQAYLARRSQLSRPPPST